MDIKAGAFKNDPLEAFDRRRFQQFLGYRFERFCRASHRTLAKILGISGVRYRHGPLFEPATRSASGRGFQCDLVFKRADRCLTIFEIKYADLPLGRSVAAQFEDKLSRIPVPKSYSVQRVLVSGGEVSAGLRSSRTFDRVIDLDELLAAED